LLAFILFFFLSISRLGLWIYDLTTQQLTQTMVAPNQRSSFTGVEYSFVSFFELAQFVIAIVLHKPEQFKWIAAMSWVATLVSTMAYAGWVWKMRGHLVHWERFGKSCECVVVRPRHQGRIGAWRRRLGDSLSLRGRS
jgi:iron-regulated transporter 1